jgi:uncharacterized membrane protein (UPF0182 family)
VHPAVVGGHIEWVVDGYTSSSSYPYSQLVNLHQASRTTYTADGSNIAQPGGAPVNYLHNSVKAVVDAYTGRGSCPTPGTRPRTVTRCWRRGSRRSPGSCGRSRPSQYRSMSADGYGPQHCSPSSPMVTLNGQQLAAFVYVNSEPGPDYGRFTVLDFPSATSAGKSPGQVQNDIESNTAITEALTLQRGGNSKVVLGDLEAIPVGGRMLYVEPVYSQSSGGSSFPVLRHVIALYGNGDPSFQNTLDAAVPDAIESTVSTGRSG